MKAELACGSGIAAATTHSMFSARLGSRRDDASRTDELKGSGCRAHGDGGSLKDDVVAAVLPFRALVDKLEAHGAALQQSVHSSLTRSTAAPSPWVCAWPQQQAQLDGCKAHCAAGLVNQSAHERPDITLLACDFRHKWGVGWQEEPHSCSDAKVMVTVASCGAAHC